MKRYILGIDPGWSGGAAIISGQTVVDCYSFTGQTECDIVERVSSMCTIAEDCLIEKVHAMPGQGVTSMFRFGHIYGLLRGCILTAKLPLREVSPVAWQRGMGCLSKGDKNVTKGRAQMLFPRIKITHANADAILIAAYGSNILSDERIEEEREYEMRQVQS